MLAAEREHSGSPQRVGGHTIRSLGEIINTLEVMTLGADSVYTPVKEAAKKAHVHEGALDRDRSAEK